MLSFCTYNFDLFEKFKIDSIKVLKILLKTNRNYMIYVKKRQYKLFVINKDRDIVKIFNIAIGKKKGFQAKTHQGDNGTPEGLYHVNEILSLDADKKTEAYKKLRRMNYIYFSATNGFHLWGKPDKDAGRKVYGVRFFRIDYPNKNDEKRYKRLKRLGKIPRRINGKFRSLGRGLAIHGTNDPASIGHRISSGCIRLKNEDVKLLDHYIKMGTPVYIEQ